MTYPTVIGVTGYAQHGKDTVGSFLSGTYRYRRFAFADQLKELALYVNPIINAYVTDDAPMGYAAEATRLRFIVEQGGWEAAKQLSEVRRFLQDLGTGVRDVIGERAWVDAVMQKINATVSWTVSSDGERSVPLTPIVLTDVRFPNEAAFIHDMGGVLVRVTRTNPDGTPFDNGIGTEHASEQYVSELPADADLVASDVESLNQQVAEWLVYWSVGNSPRLRAEQVGMG